MCPGAHELIATANNLINVRESPTIIRSMKSTQASAPDPGSPALVSQGGVIDDPGFHGSRCDLLEGRELPQPVRQWRTQEWIQQSAARLSESVP